MDVDIGDRVIYAGKFYEVFDIWEGYLNIGGWEGYLNIGSENLEFWVDYTDAYLVPKDKLELYEAVYGR